MEKKKLTRTRPLSSIEEQEQAVELLNRKKEVDKPAPAPVEAEDKPLYSYNIKLDTETEQRIKSHIGRTGQNMKGFFQIAIREYLDSHGA